MEGLIKRLEGMDFAGVPARISKKMSHCSKTGIRGVSISFGLKDIWDSVGLADFLHTTVPKIVNIFDPPTTKKKG
ncbi:hypothetical protein KAH81_02560 [bacterium]|nr:hypothetical protein [bacterium]